MKKETFYIKDKYDGQEYCISGRKHFYLIKANDIVKNLLKEQRGEIIEMLDKMQERWASQFMKGKDMKIIEDIRKLQVKLNK